MEYLARIDFGPVDARIDDPHFLRKYVEEHNFKKLVDKRYSIIVGEKGSGKTALIKGLTLKHKNQFTHIVTIGFDQVSFSAVFENLTSVADTCNLSALSLVYNYWKYSLVVEAMKKLIGSRKTQFSQAERRVFNFLVRNKHIDDDLFSRLLRLCQRMWEHIAKLTSPELQSAKKNKYPGQVPPDLVTHVKNFPLMEKEYLDAEKAFVDYIKEKDLKFLIALDGLDIIKLKTKKDLRQVTLIFEGLIAATYSISTSPLFSDVVVLKSLIPNDIYLMLDLRDLDKYEEKYARIRWGYKSLQEFLRRRIIHGLDYDRDIPFRKAWEEIMPIHVENEHIGLRENSYEYILRHTLYRPRHFQVILTMLSETYGDRLMRDYMVNEVVEESTKKLVIYLISEQSMARPRLGEFLHHFRGKPNIMPYGIFRKTVAGILNTMRIYTSVEDKIDALYNIGFIGHKRPLAIKHEHYGLFYRYRPPVKSGIDPYICDFHHNLPNLNFTHGISDEDEICIHPMFYDFCNIRPSQEFIIG